ncbi:MAG TPA: cytochrome c oxidase accessory protein CcoG [Phycisphaerales bacterium]|nr:cytochrome c oxidase accessory protein CcoG [Phycisphaerales bacterium]
MTTNVTKPADAGPAGAERPDRAHAGVAQATAARSLETAPPGILSTLNEDGSRRWLKPKPSPGRYLTRRRIVAWMLIAIFTALPWIRINGHPSILLDLSTRRFYLFGATFMPTDTLLLALLLVGAFVAVFFFTSVFGRVWCGWGCPQTVYMEFVFRPIERFFEGTPGRTKKGIFQTTPLGKVAKWIVYVVLAGHLANTFLAYFVGVDNLVIWTFRSPLEHWAPFLVFAVVTGLMLFDFGFFREQTCLVACPYGRFQSVMLDRRSLIVSYDPKRGEPRGKAARKTGADVSLPVLGDCIDCRMCVTTCPTGIDIRNGLQMECIHCTQCIDACDAVMEKIGKPRGLIRYASQATIGGDKARRLHIRPVVYAVVLTVIASAFVIVLLNRSPLDVQILRVRGLPYTTTAQGEIANNVRIRLVNRGDTPATFTVGLEDHDGLSVSTDAPSVLLRPGEMKSVLATITAPFEKFERGHLEAHVKITGDNNVTRRVEYRLVGPSTRPAAPRPTSTPASGGAPTPADSGVKP